MRLICSWQQRQLARHLVAGEPIRPTSSLAHHLTRCSECADAHRDLTRLQSEVAHVLPRVTVSVAFESTLQTRLSAAMASVPRRRSFLALAQVWSFLAAGGIVLAIGWHTVQTHTIQKNGNQAIIASTAPVRHESGSAIADTTTSLRRVRPTTTSSTEHPLLFQRRIQFAERSRAIRRRMFATVTKRNHRRVQEGRHKATVSVMPVVQIVCAASSWQEVGQVYAACGDPGSAYRAYEQAFAEQPDLDTAIAASDSALQTGDLSLAMATYARVLSMGTESDPTSISSEATNKNTDDDMKASNQ